MEGLPAKRDVRREQPGRSEALGVAVTQAGRRWPGPCARSREAWRGSGVRSATAPCRSQTKRGASSGSQQYSSRKKGREGFPVRAEGRSPEAGKGPGAALPGAVGPRGIRRNDARSGRKGGFARGRPQALGSL